MTDDVDFNCSTFLAVGVCGGRAELAIRIRTVASDGYVSEAASPALFVELVESGQHERIDSVETLIAELRLRGSELREEFRLHPAEIAWVLRRLPDVVAAIPYDLGRVVTDVETWSHLERAGISPETLLPEIRDGELTFTVAAGDGGVFSSLVHVCVDPVTGAIRFRARDLESDGQTS
jgi:hypothetical protein